MPSNFHVFGAAVRRQFDKLAKGKLFTVEYDRDAIWEAYLAAFPEGSNPIFRVRTEHDCSCCKSFIRQAGNIVSIKDGAVVTVWDVTDLPYPYQAVADTMAAYIRARAVDNIFLTPMTTAGQEKSIELIEGRTHQWHHFSVVFPRDVVRPQDYAEKRGDARTSWQMLLRAVRELTPAALVTVQGLIADNAIYRGAEFKRVVDEFAKLQKQFLGINDPTRMELAAWLEYENHSARFRNTAIGSLVVDLSEGVALEDAVKSFETKVAPLNYKRPTALITTSMVDAAVATIAKLGLEEALERRHARFSDVNINSVLFVDNAVAPVMKGSLKGLLMEEVKPAKFDPNAAEPITIDDFIGKLPAFTSLKLLVQNEHAGNFVSLTAPVHPEPKQLFRWDNDFAWSYDGNVTDSIKEKVKRAGGRVEGVQLRVSLAWFNRDDLDLHCMTPGGGHISFRNKANVLDVDMNVRGETRTPVENMRWVDAPPHGTYKFYVNQFCQRERVDPGFEIELESPAGLHHFRFDKMVQGNIHVFEVDVKKGKVESIRPGIGMTGGRMSQEKWGLKTQELVRVNSVILSPNHWGERPVGNKHWFFILEGCKNPEPARGLYNEFLSGALEKHRRVFEVLGEKTKCPVVDEQMSGLGFSSTLQNVVIVQSAGPRVQKTYGILIG